MPSAFVTGLASVALSEGERRFLAEASPWGLILFRRNIAAPDQLRRLIAQFHEAVGWTAPVLVDQEGGRVQRLTAPHWRKYPSVERLVRAAQMADDKDLIADVARLMAADLRAVGITVDCMPCLDLRIPGQSDVIGDRSYGADPHVVARAGRAACEGMRAGGVLPILKHIPGHGRATVDSHHHLPVVSAPLDDLQAFDFAPFLALADMPAAMTAHLVYTAIDPDRPATQSRIVIGEVIRGLIGFDGLLFSDDLSMQALSGPLGARTERALGAGCDIALHCNGVMAQMEEVAAAAPLLEGEARRRAETALNWIAAPAPYDREDVLLRLNRALQAYDAGAGI